MPGGATHAQGAMGRIAFEDTAATGGPPAVHPFTSDSYSTEFLSESLQLKKRYGGTRGQRGSLTQSKETLRELSRFVEGKISMYYTPNLFDWVCEKMLGWTKTGAAPPDIFTPSTTTQPYFGVAIDREEVIKQYTNCQLNWWSIQGAAPKDPDGEPEMMILTLHIYASEESTLSSWGTIPALAYAADDLPFALSDTASVSPGTGNLTLASAERAVESLQLYGLSNIDRKFTNSLYAHSMRPRSYIFGLKAKLPWNSTNLALHETAIPGAAGGVVKFSNANVSTIFTYANLTNRDRTPSIVGKEQIGFELDMVAFDSTTTKALVITNDHVP